MYKERITKEEINALEVIGFNGTIHLIDNDSQVEKAVECLLAQRHIGIDTETRPSFTKGVHYPVALLQVATITDCYLFRLNMLTKHREIMSIFTDRKLLKIGLSLHDDLRAIARINKSKPQSCVDIQKMVGDYGILELGLQKIFAIVFDKKISKAQQLTNWENPELTPQQQIYAATDAWATLLIYEELIRQEKIERVEFEE